MAEHIQTIITAKDKGATKTFKDLQVSLIALNQGIELINRSFSALSAPISAVIQEGMEFTRQMSVVKSISKITADEFAKLSKEAQRIGRTTEFTSAQAGRGMEELRRAGQSVTEVLQTTQHVMHLASAQGQELGDVAKLTAVQLNIFKKTGLSAEKAVDLMNQTLSSSPMNFVELDYALQASAGTASAAGWDFTQLTSVLGAMAEKGVVSSRAGVALNGALARLMNPTAAARKALEKYNIALDDINPSTHEFADIVDVLHDKQVSQKDLFKILGQIVAPKFFKVIEEGGDSIRNFTEKQKNANTALQSAKDRLDDLSGDVTIFNSAVSGLEITIFQTMDSVLRSTVQAATALVNAFEEFVRTNSGTLDTLFESIGTAMSFVRGLIVDLIRYIGVLLEGFGNFLLSEPIFGELFETLQEGFRSIGELIQILLPYFRELTVFIVDNVIENFKILAILFANLANVVWKILIPAIQLLKKWLSDLPLTEFLQAISEKLNIFREALRDLPNIIESVYNWIENLGESIQRVINSGLNRVIEPLKSFSKFLGLTDDEAKKLDETLTGNTLSVSLETIAKGAIETGRKMQQFGKEVKQTKKMIEDFDQVVATSDFLAQDFFGDSEDTGSTGEPPSIFGDVDTGLISQITALTDPGLWSDIGSSLVDSFFDIDWANFGLSFAESAFDVLSNAFTSIYSVVSNAILQNEDLQELLGELADTFNELFTPIATALIPLVRRVGETLIQLVGPIIDELMPIVMDLVDVLADTLPQLLEAIMPIIREVLSRILPVFVRLTEELMPSIIEILEGLLPIIETILDIVIPIIEELIPLLRALNEIIIELLPLIQVILEVVRAFVPIIRVIIRLVATLVRALRPVIRFIVSVITPILRVLIGILEPIVDVIVNLIEAIMAAPEALRDILGPFFETLRDLFGNLINALRAVNIGGGGGGGFRIPGIPGYASGTDYIAEGSMLHLPGMAPGSGLIQVHRGERILPTHETENKNNFIFNISGGNPQENAEEIRLVIERLIATRKIGL